MNSDIAGWMRHAASERWWSLSDAHLRVAMTILSMADTTDATMAVTANCSDLAERCGMSRRSMARALNALAEAGFCVVRAHRGNGGSTIIEIADPAHFNQSDPAHLNSESTNGVTSDLEETRPVEKTNGCPFEVVGNQIRQIHELGRESLAVLGDRGRFTSEKPPDLPIWNVPIWGNSGQFASNSRARDLDLLRSPSPESDLRSSDLENITSIVPTSAADEPDPPEASGKPKRRRIDPDKIPDRAWAAADYLRAQVLAKNAAAVVGTRPWESGYRWTAGAGEKVGDGSRVGLRLDWANSFRLFHARLDKAMKRANASSTPEVAWEQIARTVHWLFHKQPPSCGFIVECPDSLATKWDRIQAVKRDADGPRSQAKSAKSAPMRPKYEDRPPAAGIFSRSKPNQ